MSEANTQSWVQRLKDESWEAELLVAAISIFGTFQLFGFVEWTIHFFIERLPPSFYIVAYFIVFTLLLAVSILASMFIIHFMLRAYWVGLVGLNSVFEGYSIEHSALSKFQMQKLMDLLPTLDESVHTSDKLCSVIFSAAFGLLMAYGWIFVSGTLYLLIASYLSRFVDVLVLLIPLYIFGAVIIVQAFASIIFNLKRFQENESIQSVMFTCSMFVSRIILGPFLITVTQISTVFSSNFKSDKALVKLVMLFILSGFGLASAKVFSTNIGYLLVPDVIIDNTKADPRFYLERSEGIDYLIAPQIGSNIIERRVIEVFVPVTEHERYLYENECNALADLEELDQIEELKGEELAEREQVEELVKQEDAKQQARQKRREAELACFANYHDFTLNDQVISADMIKSRHPLTNQFGVTAYLTLDPQFGNGYHTIGIEKSIYQEEKAWQIPFYLALHN